eukprot:5667634-Amphidinium_carterae.4
MDRTRGCASTMDLSRLTLRLSVCLGTLNIHMTVVKFGRRRPNKYDALYFFEPTDNPLLAPPPLYDHQDAVVEDEVKKDPRRVRFAPELENTAPHRSGADDPGKSLIRSAIGILPARFTLHLRCPSLCTSTAHADSLLTLILLWT